MKATPVLSAGRFASGDLILYGPGSYPKDALTVHDRLDDGCLRAYAMGGGFIRKIPADQIVYCRKITAREIQSVPIRHARFGMDMDGEEFDGWTDGCVWNGWAKPGFEMPEAQRVIAWFNNSNTCPQPARYDAARDAFFIPDAMSDNADEGDWWPVTSHRLADKIVKVYPIGAGCWCWEELQEET